MKTEFPVEGYVREVQILGNKKTGTPGFIPISRSAWWSGIRSGRYPKPIKLGARTTVWRAEEIRAITGS
jgi:hypothetical protein